MRPPLPPKPGKKREIEHHLQTQCVAWFDWQYAPLRRLLFAIPNGGKRSKAVAAKLKAEGVRAGTADLFLAVPHVAPVYHGAFIETKAPDGRPSPDQIAFRKEVEEQGYFYFMPRSLEEFQETVKAYLKQMLIP